MCWEGGEGGTALPDRRRTCWEGGEGGIAPLDRRLTCREGGEGGQHYRIAG